MSGSDTTSLFSVYRWSSEDMEFVRTVLVAHRVGEQVTPEMVRAAIERDVAHYTPGRYRAVPTWMWVDFTVTAEVVLP